ncbi:PREDICTED: uncharacterized protein LOC104729682 isoform X2 [Camelina sativa]|uniref:Uncharacterized protein LOC104729682 isoform X2 n=1 Tax=Camelina sativa TaxID=90675 RepID=A0ABM0UVI4_CAMSA|nr:PREDICTED: uncharacterized protein LOC104729682 isoform X2 [Camelina sativa]
MMMRFLRSTVANKSCRMGGRLEYRGFSSAAVADVTTTTMGKKIVEYFYKVAFLGGGYVLGGLTSPPVAKRVQEVEEVIRLEPHQ